MGLVPGPVPVPLALPALLWYNLLAGVESGAVGAAVVTDILTQGPPIVKVWWVFCCV